MSPDLRSILATIVADPGDNTARLVYADCLEEQGNLPRARFIRLQIEAERLHPHSNARARVEEQAQAILVDHWIDWWGEVCAAIGFPLPVAQPRSTLGRLVRRFRDPPGHPYTPSRFEVLQRSSLLLPREARLTGWDRTVFHRGFPGSLHASIIEHTNPSLTFLQRWTTVSPLEEMCFTAPYAER